MKRIDKESVVTEIRRNEEAATLLKDALNTIMQAKSLEGHLYGTNVMGNHTLDIEAKVDAIFTETMIRRCYDVARFDCIEELNNMLGGNVIDMTGTDKQVCRRFYGEFIAYYAI